MSSKKIICRPLLLQKGDSPPHKSHQHTAMLGLNIILSYSAGFVWTEWGDPLRVFLSHALCFLGGSQSTHALRARKRETLTGFHYLFFRVPWLTGNYSISWSSCKCCLTVCKPLLSERDADIDQWCPENVLSSVLSGKTDEVSNHSNIKFCCNAFLKLFFSG